MASAFDILPLDGGTSRVCVCIFGAVHVDLTADLRVGNPSQHPTALEARSVRECDGQCQAGLPTLRVIVDLSGQAERDVRDAMRSLLASHRPDGAS